MPTSAWTCCCAAIAELPGAQEETIDIKLPIWPTKLLVAVVLAILAVRLLLQALDYIRLVRRPDAQPIAVPVIDTIEVQARNEIEEALGREAGDSGERRP